MKKAFILLSLVSVLFFSCKGSADVKPEVYNVVYETEGGVWAEDFEPVTSRYYDSVFALPDASQISNGPHIFEGWYDETDEEKTLITFIDAQTVRKDIVLVAKWKHFYNINFELDGGNWTEEYSVKVPTGYYEGDIVNLPRGTYDVEKTGAGLLGWFDNPDLSGSAVTQIPAGTTGDKVYYAKWHAMAQAISLNEKFILLQSGLSTSEELTATVSGSDTEYVVSWLSSDDEVVTCEATGDTTALVTYQGPGTATITASVDGHIATCVFVTLGSTDTMSYDEGHSVDKVTDANYKTDDNMYLEFCVNTNGALDFKGRTDNTSGHSFNMTTYSNNGWTWFTTNGSNTTPVAIKLDSNGEAVLNNGVKLKVKPILAYDKSTKTPFVILYQVLTNTTVNTISNIDLGSYADVKIGNNDAAPIYKRSYGASMYDGTVNMSLNLYAQAGKDVTPVDYLYFGTYTNAKTSNMFTVNTTSDLSGTDSGISYSWRNMELAPGETLIKSVKITLLSGSGLDE